jgi:riboflavin-specific deaminase-like protein
MTRKTKTAAGERPYVFLNVAVSADGKIATANRAVHSFGSARDLEHLYELRATADAVLSGARTVEISAATLGNGGEKFRRRRLRAGLSEYPLRIIVSGGGSIDPEAKIFQKRFSPIILLTTGRAAKQKLAALGKLVEEVKICGTKEVDFASAFRWLRERWNIQRLLCEGGGEVNDALFAADLVDEIHMTFCPKIFGGRAAPTLAEGNGRESLAEAGIFKLAFIRHQKEELFTVFSRR